MSGATRISGTLNSTAGTAFQVDLYANPACDPSGNGEGQTYLGSTGITTDGSGNASFAVLGLPAAALGNVITATATDAAGNTSEFSACRTVVAPGVTVTPTAVTVTEGGAGSSFTVALTGVPTTVVTINLAVDASPLNVSPTTLTFRPDATAVTPQTVTVNAVDDSLAEGTHTSPIAFAAISGDPAYAGVAIPPVTVTIVDNDTASIVVAPTSGLVTTEAGGTTTFTVRLSTIPTSTVTIGLSSSDTTEGTVAPSSLTFQPNASALTPQTVTVTGVDDALADGDIAYTIVTAPATSADPSFNGVNPPDVTVTNRDDETAAGLNVADTTVSEPGAAGGTSTVNLTVTLAPASVQTVTVQYATANGTATGGTSCTGGVDYLTASGTLTFAPGEPARPSP